MAFFLALFKARFSIFSHNLFSNLEKILLKTMKKMLGANWNAAGSKAEVARSKFQVSCWQKDIAASKMERWILRGSRENMVMGNNQGRLNGDGGHFEAAKEVLKP